MELTEENIIKEWTPTENKHYIIITEDNGIHVRLINGEKNNDLDLFVYDSNTFNSVIIPHKLIKAVSEGIRVCYDLTKL